MTPSLLSYCLLLTGLFSQPDNSPHRLTLFSYFIDDYVISFFLFDNSLSYVCRYFMHLPNQRFETVPS